jgi:hypothetical protein
MLLAKQAILARQITPADLEQRLSSIQPALDALHCRVWLEELLLSGMTGMYPLSSDGDASGQDDAGGDDSHSASSSSGCSSADASIDHSSDDSFEEHDNSFSDDDSSSGGPSSDDELQDVSSIQPSPVAGSYCVCSFVTPWRCYDY